MEGIPFAMPSMKPLSTTKSLSPLDNFVGVDGLDGEVIEDLRSNTLLHKSLGDKLSPNQTLLSLCISLQTHLKTDLEKLQRAVAKNATQSRTPIATSHGVGGGGPGGGISSGGGGMVGVGASSHGHGSSSGSGAGNMAKRPALPPGVRLLYFNVCNRAIKVQYIQHMLQHKIIAV